MSRFYPTALLTTFVVTKLDGAGVALLTTDPPLTSFTTLCEKKNVLSYILHEILTLTEDLFCTP